MTIELGSKVKDSLTAFQGTVIGRAEYLHEAPCIQIQPLSIEATGHPEAKWYAEARFSPLGATDDISAKKEAAPAKVAGTAKPVAETKPAEKSAEATVANPLEYDTVKAAVLKLAKKNKEALIGILQRFQISTALEIKDQPATLANFYLEVQTALA
jgi:hypothetical protein